MSMRDDRNGQSSRPWCTLSKHLPDSGTYRRHSPPVMRHPVLAAVKVVAPGQRGQGGTCVFAVQALGSVEAILPKLRQRPIVVVVLTTVLSNRHWERRRTCSRRTKDLDRGRSCGGGRPLPHPGSGPTSIGCFLPPRDLFRAHAAPSVGAYGRLSGKLSRWPM